MRVLALRGLADLVQIVVALVREEVLAEFHGSGSSNRLAALSDALPQAGRPCRLTRDTSRATGTPPQAGSRPERRAVRAQTGDEGRAETHACGPS